LIRPWFRIVHDTITASAQQMASADQRRAIPFSPSEKALQEPPYIYTSGTIPINELDADYVFYQTWTDARVPQKNVDV